VLLNCTNNQKGGGEMNGKVRSIVALLAILTLVVGLVPLAACDGCDGNAWEVMPIPSTLGQVLLPGSTIVDFDVAGNGTTIYALTGLGAGQRIAKSVDGGRMWFFVSEPTTWTGPGSFIRVASDNTEAVVVVDTVGADVNEHVFLSNNGGTTWTDLGDPVASATGAADASEIISDVEVSPMVANSTLERDVVVCTYNTDNCQLSAGGNWGDIYAVGTTTTWMSVAQAAGANYDWTSIALEPAWVGGYGIIGIGSDNVSAGNAEVGWTGDTYMVPFNADLAALAPAPFIITPPGPVNLDTGTYDSPCERTASPQGPAENGRISTSDVALPDDFASTSLVEFQSYLGWTSVQLAGVITNGDDVYRVDFNAAKKLEIASSVAIYSVDYTGTSTSGTLFAGERHKTQSFLPIGVWFTANPTSGLPSWSFSYKPPTSTATANTNCKILASPVDSNVVFGGCAGGPDTAFSMSEDGGVSFNGIGLVDDAIDTMPDVMPTPDGKYVFLATANLTSNNQSLWRCLDVPATGAWERVGFVTPAPQNGFTNPTSIVRISPDLVEGQTIYWVGTAGGTNILRSPDNGQIWAARTAGAAGVVDVAVESADVLYMISGTHVYASTNGAWSWGLPSDPSIGVLTDIAMAPDYPLMPLLDNVLVGGTGGSVAYSTDGGNSFTPLPPLPVGGNVQVCADEDYATNNIIYAGSSNGGVYRYQGGSWQLINSSVASVSGLVTDGGCLYAADAIPGGGVYRMGCGPPYHLTDGLFGGETFDREPNALRCSACVLFAIDTTGNKLYRYED
jgi:hypothetical protein